MCCNELQHLFSHDHQIYVCVRLLTQALFLPPPPRSLPLPVIFFLRWQSPVVSPPQHPYTPTLHICAKQSRVRKKKEEWGRWKEFVIGVERPSFIHASFPPPLPLQRLNAVQNDHRMAFLSGLSCFEIFSRELATNYEVLL